MTFRDKTETRPHVLAGAGTLQRAFNTPNEPALGASTGRGFNLSEAHLRSVFLAMAEGLVFQASGGQIIDANLAAERILGLSRDQLLGKASMDPDWQAIREDGSLFPGPEHPAMVTLRTGQPIHNQIMGVRTPDEGLRWIIINSQPVFAVAEVAAPTAVVVTFVDITLQRQLSEDLRLAQEEQRAILDNVPARITSWNADSTLIFANQVAAAQFGIRAEDAVGKHCQEVLGEMRYLRARPSIEAALAGERQSHEQIDPQIDGSLRYSHVEYVPKLRDGQVQGLYSLATDVTELRESYRRVRELAQRLETVREEERRASAQLLHEGIAQDLYAMKLGLDHLQAQATNRTGVAQACRELADAINHCMNATRQIAHGFWPSAMGHLRVAVAIGDHARHFGEMSRLTIRVVEMAPFPALKAATGLVFFRAAQEALTNVARHAHASTVDIVLRADDDFITMSVTDDGIGIDESALSKAGCHGLFGLRERVLALAGALAVRRNVEGGTTVSVNLPHSSDLSD